MYAYRVQYCIVVVWGLFFHSYNSPGPNRLYTQTSEKGKLLRTQFSAFNPG